MPTISSRVRSVGPSYFRLLPCQASREVQEAYDGETSFVRVLSLPTERTESFLCPEARRESSQSKHWTASGWPLACSSQARSALQVLSCLKNSITHHMMGAGCGHVHDEDEEEGANAEQAPATERAAKTKAKAVVGKATDPSCRHPQHVVLETF